MLDAICWSEGEGWTRVRDVSTISDLIEKRTAVWAELDVDAIDADDVAICAEELGLHALAVEDAINPRQRPKLESYDNHVFLVLHQLDTVDGQLEARQIASFVGDSWVLVVHAGAGRTLADVRRRLESSAGPPGGRESAFLVHVLLDTVVDGCQRIADDLEEEVERIEELLLTTPAAPIQTGLYSVKQRLARFRRFGLPIARIVEELADDDRGVPAVGPELAAYFRDVDDHIQRIAGQVRNADDLANAALDLHRMHQSNALNEVTKRLTGWGAIIAVPTFIASVYGMNFRLFPRDGSIEGFVSALCLMLVSAVLLYAWFRRRNWI